jgi:hypothetical protein
MSHAEPEIPKSARALRKNSASSRFVFNGMIYAVFGGGLAGFLTHGNTDLDAGTVVVTVLLAAIWASTWSTLVELKVYPMASTAGRAVLGGLFGALSLAGLAAACSMLAWHGLNAKFLVVAAVAGALMQASRAAAVGGR